MNETICNIMLFGGIALAVIFAIVAVVIFIKLDIPKVIGDLTGSTAKKQIKEIREKGYESIQGSGASKKDAIKSKNSTGKIEVRDIKDDRAASEELSRKSEERYKKAVSELNRQKTEKQDDYERETDILSETDEYESETDVLQDADTYEEATDVLQDASLQEEATDVLSGTEDYEEATDILTEDGEEATDILTAEAEEEATDILTAEAEEEATDILTAEAEEETTDVLRGKDIQTTDQEETFVAAGFQMLTDVVVTHSEETIEGGKE